MLIFCCFGLLKYCRIWLTFAFNQGLILSKALKNRKNIDGEATHKEIVKLRSKASELHFDYAKK